MHDSSNPQLCRQHVAGFTLIELAISLVIFSAVTVIALESLISAKQMQGQAAAEDSLNRSAADVYEIMSVDLAESGWWFSDTNMLPAALTADRSARYYPYVHQQALGGLEQGLGQLMRNHWRPATAVQILPGRFADRPQILAHLVGSAVDGTSLFGANRLDYRRSYFARSQELIFVRQTTMGWTETPGSRSLPTLVFPNTAADGTPFDWSNDAGLDYTETGNTARMALGVLMPSGWERDPVTNTFSRRAYDVNRNGTLDSPTEGTLVAGPDVTHTQPYGIGLPSAKLTDVTSVTLANQWETLDVPDYDPLAPAQELREYTYVVVPSPIGMGRLVRAYTAPITAENTARPVGVEVGQRLPQTATPTAYVVVDRVLSDDVVRVVFDTYRTDPNLLINEIRVRLYMARENFDAGNDRLITRVVEGLLLMRARSTNDADAADATQASGAVVLNN